MTDNRIRFKEAVNKLQKDCKEKGLQKPKKTEIGARVFSSYTMYNYYESGHCFMIDRETVLRACKELNCSADFLFGIETKVHKQNNEWESFLNDMHQWQLKTFGKATPVSKLHHLKEEINELIEDLEKGKDVAFIKHEYADAFFLLFGSLYVYGFEIKHLLGWMKAKLEINKIRKWGKPNKNGVVNHIK